MFFSKKQSKKIIGLDIGSKNIKLMGFKNIKETAVVDLFRMVPTPPDAFHAGLITNEEVLKEFITKQILELELENQINIILGITGKGMIAKKINLPQIADNMVAEFIEIEAEQELFYNKAEMRLDYQILEGLNFENPADKSAFVFTVSNKVLDSYNQVIPEELISCDVLDTNFSALFNVAEYSGGLQDDEVSMLIDVGCFSTNIIIIIKKQIVFARNLPMGGHFFTQSIQTHMSLEEESAEDLKISASKGGDSPEEVVSLIKTNLNPSFSEEVMSCYELFLSLFPKHELGQIYITGGAGQTLGLKDDIEEKFNCPTAIFNPFEKISFDSSLGIEPNQYKYFSSIVSGLALRALQ